MNRRLGAWLIIFAGMLLCRGMYLHDSFYNVDEAEYVVAADMMSNGGLPGVDLLGSTKPPGIAVLYWLLFELFGRSLTVIHVAQLAASVVFSVLVVEIVVVLWGIAAAIPAAVLIMMTANSFSLPSEMLALNVELPGMVLVALGLWIGLRWEGRKSLIVAGALIGLAALFRQSLIFFAAPLVVYAAVRATKRVEAIFCPLAGAAIPWLIVGITYAVLGGLGWAIDSWFRYPAVYAADVGIEGFFQALVLNFWEFLLACLAPIIIAAVGKLSLLKAWKAPRNLFALSLGLASFFALCSGSRFFGHYFYQMFPVAVLFGVPGWIWLRERSIIAKRALIGIVAVGSLIALVHFPAWKFWDESADPNGVPRAGLEAAVESELVSRVRNLTQISDRIAVWGYYPQLYYLADRLPGTRDYLCHYVTGFSTGSFDPFVEKPYRISGHPEARAMFLTDLKQNQPALFVDLSNVRDYEYSFVNLPLTDYPEIADYVREHYHPEREIGRVLVYHRRAE